MRNVICDHRIACCPGNWGRRFELWLSVWVHRAVSVLHFWWWRKRKSINVGTLEKVMVADLPAISGTWVCIHVTAFTCETWNLAFCCISQRNGTLSRLHARTVLRHHIYTSTRTDSSAACENPRDAPWPRPEKSPPPQRARILGVTRAVTHAGTSCSLPGINAQDPPHRPWPRPHRPGSNVARADGRIRSPCTWSRRRPDVGWRDWSAACREHGPRPRRAVDGRLCVK